MSGCYQTENQSAAGGLDDTMQQVREAYAAAMAANAARQVDSRVFITTNGHEASPGHSPVGAAAPHDIGQQATT